MSTEGGVPGAHQVIDCDMEDADHQPSVVPVNPLRSWVEDLPAADTEGGETGDVQMGKGIPSVAVQMTTLPRCSRLPGSSLDMQEWLCVLVGRLHWCEWGVSKGVVQVRHRAIRQRSDHPIESASSGAESLGVRRIPAGLRAQGSAAGGDARA